MRVTLQYRSTLTRQLVTSLARSEKIVNSLTSESQSEIHLGQGRGSVANGLLGEHLLRAYSYVKSPLVMCLTPHPPRPHTHTTAPTPNSKHWFTTSFLQGGRCRKAVLGVCPNPSPQNGRRKGFLFAVNF